MTELSRRHVLTGAARPPPRPRSRRLLIAGLGRGAAGRQAGAGLVPLQGRHAIEITAVTDGRNTFRCPTASSLNAKKDQVNEALAAALHGKGHDDDPVLADRHQHRLQARRDRHRHRRSELRPQQGRRRPVPQQPEGRRHRPQRGRHRHHLALPRRPHQRPAHAGRQAGVPQRRDPRAGGGVEILHGRRRDGQADHRPHEGRVRGRAHACSTRSTARSRNTSRQGSGAGHHLGRDPRPHARPHVATWSRRATARCYVQSDVTNHPALFVRNPGWHAFFDQDRRWPRRPAARSTTCWWPRR